MIDYEVGKLARSKAGHDKGKVYVILDVDDEYVYLTDGCLKPVENPKKKKKMHIQIINKIGMDGEETVRNESPTNEQIKKAISNYMKD